MFDCDGDTEELERRAVLFSSRQSQLDQPFKIGVSHFAMGVDHFWFGRVLGKLDLNLRSVFEI
ncbi:hypothetical protein SPHINGOT1_620025 [Sphingomonas sp. T1]|nr:hypothetical protein SPHINGOT1_620025 [Sphingomonas sp. T1]